MDDETRTARQKAIAEKKRRLEEIKARRNASSGSVAPPSGSAAPSGNLDEYIDELLKSSTPALATVAAPPEEEKEEVKDAPSESTAPYAEVAPSPAPVQQPITPSAPPVEKFEVAIQCEEDDFPPPSLIDEDEPKDDESNQQDVPTVEHAKSESHDIETLEPLTQQQKSKLISTHDFTKFISTASKRVERLLDSSDQWIVDYVEDIQDASQENVKKSEHAYQHGGFFTSKSTYEYKSWTQGRNITHVEWCPSHPEWVLTSYNSRGANVNNPSSRHLSPLDPSSAFLSNPVPNEGIVAIYNLILPSRPEHVFCAGCPIVKCKFHPGEHPKLVLGGGTSGQLLVWDARVGRYPVQRSAGHNVNLVGMELIDEGNNSKLVTASSDGKIHYWSVSNMREPVESFKVDANLSCLDVLQSKNEGIVCGDERGGIHAVYSASSSAGAGSSSLKRVVRTLKCGVDGMDVEEENAMDVGEEVGHFGMVTAVAARPFINNSNSPRSASTGGTFKGFLQGAGGLVVTTGVDWSTKFWAPAYTDKPLMTFLNNSYDYMCDVQWSPVYPSIFATASSNGSLNIWNLATSLDQPISGSDGIQLDDNISSSPESQSATPNQNGLNRIKWSADGRRLAVASGDQLHVLGVGEDLLKSKGDEEAKVMNHLVSRGLIQGDVE